MLAPTLAREPVEANDNETEAFAAIEEIVLAGPVDLVGAESGRRIALPPAARAILSQAAHAFLRGNRVALVPVGTKLTTQQAAELLNVSRPYLVRLLDADKLPFEMVGTHRRLDLNDVLRYRDERGRRRREVLRRLGEDADDLGIYTE